MGKERKYNLLDSDAYGTEQEGGRGQGFFRLICCVGVFVLFLIVGIGVGVMIGYFVFGGAKTTSSCSPQNPSPTTNNSKAVLIEWGALVNDKGNLVSALDKGADQMEAINMENNLKMLTELPHIAGSDQNNKLASAIHDTWKQLQLDKVEEIQYNVLLQYPNDTNPNKFQIVGADGKVIFDAPTAQLEPAITDDEKKPGVARPFNSYSGVGYAKGPLVYVNYGRREDFQFLASMNISLSGCVCMARYGRIFRGSKAMLAEQNGCLGMVLYSDPQDYGPKKGYPAYPEGWSLPVTGLQRGSVMLSEGDPLTPLRPAITDVYRRTYKDALDDHAFPSIPVTPLSSSDAYHFLSILSQTNQAPDGWQGGLNTTYYIGPGFNDDNKNYSAYIEVNSYFANRTIIDVVGTIYGSQEPDHLVLLGNHRDAWVFGGVDPNSGTAALLEVARSLSMLRASGWRPGRTVMLCSWDAEEYGLLGSTEFAEDRSKQLLLNAVAYLNVDSAVAGYNYVGGQGSPLLIPAIYQAVQKVTSPNDPSMTVYEEWLKYDPDSSGKPMVRGLGSGSDFTPFLQNLGIASSDYSYTSAFNATYNFVGYPVYHSIHDTFEWVKKSVDFNFTHHLALGKVWLRTALYLATTPIIPFGVVEYGDHLRQLAMSLNESTYTTLMEQDISLDFIFSSIDSFKMSAQALQNATNYVNSQNFNETTSLKKWRILNSKLIGIERSFLVPEGLPGRPFFKHAIYAPSKFNSYASSAFPGITDSIFEANWPEVRKQVSIAALSIRSAANVISDALEVSVYDQV